MPIAIRTRKVRAALIVGILLAVAMGTAIGDAYVQELHAERGRQETALAAEAHTDPSMSMPGLMPLPVGGPAPDLDLPALDGGGRFRLADQRGVSPVVLVFGSFTCDLLQGQLEELARIYRRHRGRAAFAFVAVREGRHKLPGYEFLLESDDPTAAGSAERRRRCVSKAVALSGMPLPAYLDPPDEPACLAYQAWPRRLVVVDPEGRIALDFGSSLGGPWDLGRLERYLEARSAFPPGSPRRRVGIEAVPSPR